MSSSMRTVHRDTRRARLGVLVAIASGVLAPAVFASASEPEGGLPGAKEQGPAETIGRHIDEHTSAAVDLLRRRAGEWRAWGLERARQAEDAARNARVDLFGDDLAARPALVSVACVQNPVEGGSAVRWSAIGGTGLLGPAAHAADGQRRTLAAHAPRRVVLLVHGLDEPDGLWLDLAPALVTHGHTVLKLDYPNDQSPAESADVLAATLAWIALDPSRGGLGVAQVDLVGHSMGGLLIRDVLTRPTWYGGRGSVAGGLPKVERAILLAAPNAGSRLAMLQPLSEAREQILRHARGEQDAAQAAPLHAVAGWLHAFADGAGEAAIDLRPGSAYLTDLNTRPLPTDVRWTNIVAHMTPGGLGDAETRAVGESAAVREILHAAVHELAQEMGDGLVSLESQALPGVEDVVHVHATHRGLVQRWRMFDGMRAWLGEGESGEVPAAVPVIVDRLARN